jgi:hypothetical protein
MDYVPNFLHEPLPINFNRRLTEDMQIESTCRRCGLVLVGSVSTGHALAERRHIEQCEAASGPQLVNPAEKRPPAAFTPTTHIRTPKSNSK